MRKLHGISIARQGLNTDDASNVRRGGDFNADPHDQMKENRRAQAPAVGILVAIVWTGMGLRESGLAQLLSWGAISKPC